MAPAIGSLTLSIDLELEIGRASKSQLRWLDELTPELVGLLGRFPDVLLGRLAFGHDVEIVARAAQQ